MDGARASDRGASSPAAERILVSVAALGIIAALFLARDHDDNRLTSWRWVFSEGAPALLFGLTAAGIALANMAALPALHQRRPAVLLFLVAFAVGRCFWAEPEVIVDASRYFAQAKHLEIHGLGSFWAEWGRKVSAWTDLPLMPLLYGLAFANLGEARWVVQAATTLMFAGTAAVTVRIGQELWDAELGFAAGALLLASPYLLTQVPLMLVDVPTMFFFALAVFAVLKGCRRGTWPWLLAAAMAVSAAMLAKYSTWLLLSIVPVIAAVLHRTGERRALARAGAIALLSGVMVASALLAHRESFLRQLALLRSYQAPGLRRWGESHASTFLFQIHPFLTLSAMVSLGRALWRRDWKFVIVLWPVLLLIGLDIHRARYLVPVFPMLALMGAFGLKQVRERATRSLIVACAAASSVVVALFGFLPFLEGTSAANLAAAGQFLDALEAKRIEVYTVASRGSEVNPAVAVPLLDLFTAKELSLAGAASAEPPKGAETSALRFTWEYRRPDYYEPTHGDAPRAIVVISEAAGGPPLPEHLAAELEGYHLARSFSRWEGIFRYRTMLDVYTR